LGEMPKRLIAWANGSPPSYWIGTCYRSPARSSVRGEMGKGFKRGVERGEKPRKVPSQVTQIADSSGRPYSPLQKPDTWLHHDRAESKKGEDGRREDIGNGKKKDEGKTGGKGGGTEKHAQQGL